jgi:hypothetical protein
MDLVFNLSNEMWVAEFEATADFNIHLEREVEGMFKVYQKTSGNDFALIDDLGDVYTQYKDVIDYDFAGVIFPKMIRVVSASEPTMAVVTFKA